MLKKAISLLILVMYLHGMSGYTMNFHKCMITGFENVYTGYGLQDPCGEEEENDCNATSTHFEQADCCDLEQTFVSVDDERDITQLKLPVSFPCLVNTLFPSYVNANSAANHSPCFTDYMVKPPKLCDICVFRI